MTQAPRQGVIAGGNFIVDHVKIVDQYPDQEMLAEIVDQTATNGGGPYNLLTDLSRMTPGVRLEAIARIGDDADGRWILDDCRASGIDTTQVRATAEAPTSYTDAMTVRDTGRRTFFHRRGANALLDVDDFDFSATAARVFHLAYLFLLDRLDAADSAGSTGAARVLANAQSRGLITCADAVSVRHPQARRLVEAAAPHVDHLLLNEVELEHVTGRTSRGVDGAIDAAAVADGAEALLGMGVGQSVVVHFVEGAVAVDRAAGRIEQAAVRMPADRIAGSVGAGDAFAAGYLWGVHEDRPPATRLQWAVCTAAMSLTHPTASRGVGELPACLQLADQYGYREPDSLTLPGSE